MSILFLLWMSGLFLNVRTFTASFVNLGVYLFLFILYVVPGHLMVYPLMYRTGKKFEGFIWGTVAGLAVSSYLLMLIVYVFGWDFRVIFLMHLIFALGLLFMMRKKHKKRLKQENPQENPIEYDYRTLLLVFLLITLFFYFPFQNLGKLVGDKYLFAWLFGHDFICKIGSVVGISYGIPVASLSNIGEISHYYYLSQIFPALVYKIGWLNLKTQSIVQLTVMLYSFITASALFLFVCSLVRKKKGILLLLLSLAFICYSYMDIYLVFKSLWVKITGETSLELIGHDILDFSGLSHSFYRFFLAQPQASMGISVVILILVLRNRKDRTSYSYLVSGLLLGILFGIEASIGLMMVIWSLLMTLYDFILSADKRTLLLRRNLFLWIPAYIIYKTYFVVGMYGSESSGELQLAANWFAISVSPMYFLIEYGPMFLLGITGLGYAIIHREKADHWVYEFAILMGIGLFFVFFVTNPRETQYGLQKSSRLIPICLLAFTAYLFNRVHLEKKIKWFTILLMLFAVPTLFTDNFLASDITNPQTFIRSDDVKATDWIKKNLPRDAVIQAEPNHPGKDGDMVPLYYYSLIPLFAERPTAAGEWKTSGIGCRQEKTDRYHEIKKMFGTTDVSEALNIIKKHNIQYVYIGKLEKQQYPEGTDKFEKNEEVFTKVYARSNVEIYKINNVSK